MKKLTITIVALLSVHFASAQQSPLTVSAGQAWINTANAAWALPPAGGDFDGAHVSIAGRSHLERHLIDACDAALVALGM